jgi:uncharacterized protein
MCIGSLKEGFNFEKARNYLNVCKLTEEQCKNCWAMGHCTICGRVCDNNGELSAELKLARCDRVRYETEYSLLRYTFLKEFGDIKL